MPNLLLDLRYLCHAIAAAEHRSFRRTADALGLPQSTVSRRIKMLEDTLGIQILRRLRSGIEVTKSGARFLSAARINADKLQRVLLMT